MVLPLPTSWPDRLPRERWEPVLFEGTRTAGEESVTVQLGDAPFPALLRRRNFFDATGNRLAAMRLLKRWLWQWEQGATHSISAAISSDLEYIYAGIGGSGRNAEGQR